jgi:hypothetical protein
MKLMSKQSFGALHQDIIARASDGPELRTGSKHLLNGIDQTGRARNFWAIGNVKNLKEWS